MEFEPVPKNEILIKEIGAPLFQSKSWIRFLGILGIVYGGFVAITIVGILFAWLPIWLGILLNQTATRLEQAERTGNKEALMGAHKSLSVFFTIYGVLALVSILLGILLIVVLFATGWIWDLQRMTNQNYY